MPPPTGPRRRRALLIGNDAYQHCGALRAAIKDAKALHAKLKALGFDEVHLCTDLTGNEMLDAVDSFRNGIRPGDITLFFFSGHGGEQLGKNYLLGVDAKENKHGVELEVNVLGELLHQAEKQIVLCILDACRADRSNTVYRGERSVVGQRSVMAPVALGSAGARDSDIHILQACDPGQVARETAQGGYLTQALLEYIADPGEFILVMRKVMARVRQISNNQQRSRFDMGGDEPFSLSSSHNSATSAGCVISREVDSYVRDEIADETMDVDQLLRKLKDLGIRTLTHLEEITQDDLVSVGVPKFEARRVERKRPVTARLQPPHQPQPQQSAQSNAMPCIPETTPAPQATVTGQDCSPQAQGLQETLAMLKVCKGSLAQVQAALRQHAGSAEVAKEACWAIGDALSNNADNQAEAGRLGLLADLQAALRQHAGSAIVAWRACWAIKHALSNNADNKAEAGRLGLLADLQAALRTHAGSAEVAWRACSAIGVAVSLNDGNRAEAGRLGLLADLQAALRQHAGSAKVAKEACLAIGDAVRSNADNRAEAGRLGLLADLQAALRTHAGSAEVAKEACYAIGNAVFNNADIQAEARRLGLLADLQAALRQHAGSAGVSKKACLTIGFAVSKNADNRAEAGRLGLLADLGAALRQHAGLAEVTQAACLAIGNAVFNNADNRAEARRLGLLADLQAALRQHGGSAATYAQQAIKALQQQ